MSKTNQDFVLIGAFVYFSVSVPFLVRSFDKAPDPWKLFFIFAFSYLAVLLRALLKRMKVL